VQALKSGKSGSKEENPFASYVAGNQSKLNNSLVSKFNTSTKIRDLHNSMFEEDEFIRIDDMF
jgi:hypothetical protein